MIVRVVSFARKNEGVNGREKDDEGWDAESRGLCLDAFAI